MDEQPEGGMAVTMNKSQVVLWNSHMDSLVFSPKDADLPIVVVDADTWEDMGRPFKITVTIEPGDKLNAD